LKPLPIDDAFFQSLRELDRELFLRLKGKRCPHCGSPLDTSNYPRKTRGMGDADECRYSLCCRREGCRSRLTPPSLRFLGRKVHAAWRVVMVQAFREVLGIEPVIARQTLSRWRNFWLTTLREDAPFMRWARGSGLLPLSVGDSPSCCTILRALGFPGRESWLTCLRFFTQFPA
jgi:hypothetical protein